MPLLTMTQRSWRWPWRLLGLAASAGLALAALLLLVASVSAAGRAAPARAPNNLPSAVVFTVTTNLDTPDQWLTDTLCLDAAGKCSLRAAVQQLDHDNGGAILLGFDTYTLTDDADGDLQLRQNIKIFGPYYVPFFTFVIGKPGWTHRIFRVQDGAEVTLSTFMVEGGHAPGANGGGLDIVSGTVTAQSMVFDDNSALAGGGIYNGGQLNLAQSWIHANGSSGDGAGIFNAAAPAAGTNLTVTDSQIENNVAGVFGGGLYNLGQVNMMSSTLKANYSAQGGGGAANFSGARLVIQASTLVSNVATAGGGGGLYNVNSASVVKLVNSTVVSNAASEFGGGIANFTSQVQLFNVTVAENVANTSHPASGSGGGGLFTSGSAFRLENTLVGENRDLLNLAPDCDGAFDSRGYNLVQSVTGCTLTNITAGNITGTAPLLLPLDYYGGSTPTMGLSLNSPAIDAGNPAGCLFGAPLLADQRGRPRPTDGNADDLARCDIGAYELQLARVFLPLAQR